MKTYVLDTNVILDDPLSIFKFKNNFVILPIQVIEEVDRFKKNMDQLGRNARYFSNLMDELRNQGNLADGVSINDHGCLKVIPSISTYLKSVNLDLDFNITDNQILACAIYARDLTGFETIFVTNDTNLRIKSDCFGIKAESYRSESIDVETMYTGVKKIEIKSEDEISSIDCSSFKANEFVEFYIDGELIKTLRYDKKQKLLVELMYTNLEPWGLKAINKEQEYALELLLNDDIKLVSLVGSSGCGKSLLAIAAALHKTTDDFVYKKVLVSRPVMQLGKETGHLPGDLLEKMAPFMQPIYDNVEFLMSDYISDGSCAIKKTKSTKKLTAKEKRDMEEKESGCFGQSYKELLAAGIMQVEALTYIRGRSIASQIMILDEIQNLSQHEVKAALTRAGHGCKIIITGDIEQIDHPYLDAVRNGLSYVVEKFSNESIAGHILLTKCERSELAELAAKLL